MDGKLIFNYDNYVCGTRFQDIADYIFDEKSGTWKQQNLHLEKPYKVLYCHTHQFNLATVFISRFAAEYNDSIVLITHNSDGAVRSSNQGQEIREHDADASLLPSCVVKWYAQNVECKILSNKIVPIPIGLENRYCFDYDKAEMLFNKEKDIHPSKEIYLNCNMNTNIFERGEVYRLVSKTNATCRLGKNGENYDRYLDEILDHYAVISPRGNGLDCHRTYEALYLNRIPIMKYEYSLYSMNLPTIWVHSWESLVRMYELIVDQAVDMYAHDVFSTCAMLPLDINYWRKRIHAAK